MANVATTQNLTLIGVATIIAAVANAALEYVSHKPIDTKTLLTGISLGLTGILAKGAANTGGTVPSSAEAVKRVQGGFIRLAPLHVLALLCGFALTGCAFFSQVSGTTGPIDFGKGIVCSVTVQPTNKTTCTKGLAQACTFPLPKDASGNCILDALIVDVPFAPGPGWACDTAAVNGASACTKTVTTTCTAPAAKNPDGSCQ